MIDINSLKETFLCEAFDSEPLTIVRLLGKGKSGYSYLVRSRKGEFVLKVIHDEPCPYYEFPESKTKAEVEAYRRLTELGVSVPELYYYDLEQEFLIKQYIASPTVVEQYGESSVPDEVIRQLWVMAESVKNHQINIDYFPTNFVVENNRLYYVDYEINPYDPQWDLSNWGLYYWANLNGVLNYLHDRNDLHINVSLEQCTPIIEPFAQQVAQWRSLAMA